MSIVSSIEGPKVQARVWCVETARSPDSTHLQIPSCRVNRLQPVEGIPRRLLRREGCEGCETGGTGTIASSLRLFRGLLGIRWQLGFLGFPGSVHSWPGFTLFSATVMGTSWACGGCQGTVVKVERVARTVALFYPTPLSSLTLRNEPVPWKEEH